MTTDWTKVKELGKMSDRALAAKLGVGSATVWDARKRLGIPPYNPASVVVEEPVAESRVELVAKRVEAAKPEVKQAEPRPIRAIHDTPETDTVYKRYQLAMRIIQEGGAKDTKDQINRQVLQAMERLLKRAGAALTMYQAHNGLCEDIFSVLKWLEEIQKPEKKAA